VFGLSWDQLDLDAGVWIKPSAHTKQKREHRVPLSAPVRQLLVAMRDAAEQHAQETGKELSTCVFPGRTGAGPVVEVKRAWATIARLAALNGVRLHDLRHTYASLLASSGLSLPVIGALLGHTQLQTTARYTHLLDDPLRAATERVGAIVSAAATPRASAVKGGPR
jgi:integrase